MTAGDRNEPAVNPTCCRPAGLQRAWLTSRTAGIPSHVEKPSIDPRSERGVGAESPSQARMHRRLGRRLPLGGLVGAIAGAVVGALVGLLFFEGSAAILTSVLAAGVFGLGVGMLIAGYSSLESPDPGAEPSDTVRPVTDRPDAVREEHPDVPEAGTIMETQTPQEPQQPEPPRPEPPQEPKPQQ
jgi:hypothetical protein